MKLNFKLRQGKKAVTILAELRSGSIRIRKSTNIQFSIGSKKYWNKKTQRFNYPNNIPNSDIINQKLNDIIREVNVGFDTLVNNENLSNMTCETLLVDAVNVEKKEIAKLVKNSKVYFLNYFDYYIEFYSENPTFSTKKPLAKGTVRTLKNAKNFFRAFLIDSKIEPDKFTFNDIDKRTYQNLISFGAKKEYRVNYVGTVIQKIKRIMKSAHDDGIHNNLEFTKSYFSRLKEDVDSVFLNTSEIIKIKKVSLKTPFLNDVRDVFLICLYTGMRIGDLLSFVNQYDEKKMKFKTAKNYIFRQSKTSNPAIINISSELLDILKKRDFTLPKITSETKFNETVKIVCKRAGIKQLVKKRLFKGFKEVEKYKLVSSRTGRLSFCTNAYLMGIPNNAIMTVSGHKKEEVFLKYIKASNIEKAQAISEIDFIGINKTN